MVDWFNSKFLNSRKLTFLNTKFSHKFAMSIQYIAVRGTLEEGCWLWIIGIHVHGSERSSGPMYGKNRSRG